MASRKRPSSRWYCRTKHTGKVVRVGGLGMGMKLAGVMFLIMLAMGGIGYWYYNDTQARMAILQENNAKLEIAVETNEAALESLQADYADKLIEETNYNLEIEQSKAIAEACKHLPHIKFPDYYEDCSCDRIITMDYMNGLHISEFIKTEFSQETANQLGQALWDFYMFQIHGLRKVQADPHPGNFMVSKQGELIAIDFGCVKEIPEEFYTPYFELSKKENIENEETFVKLLTELEILLNTDPRAEVFPR